MINRLKEILCVILTILMLFIQFESAAGQTQREVVIDCDKAQDDPVTCLACNLYHESRSESNPGLWLVALATWNRVKGDLYPAKKISTGPKIKKEGYEDQFCQVVFEQRKDKDTGNWVAMFSWTRDGKHDRVYNRGRWYDVLELATKVYAAHTGAPEAEEIFDFTFGCQWYHALSVSPDWSKVYHPTVTVGNHRCYVKDEQVFLNKLSESVPGIGMLRAVNLEMDSITAK